MKHQRINYIAVGSFVVAMFGALIWTLFQITGQHGPTDQYSTMLHNVTGLRSGTPVSFEGYGIGRVEAITPMSENGHTRFRIDFTVTKGWAIPRGSVAKVVSTGVLSVVSIDIQAGDNSVAMKPGEVLPGQIGVDMMAAITEAASDMRGLTRDTLRPMLVDLQQRIGTLGGSLETGVNSTILNLEKLTTRLNEQADALSGFLSDENRIGVEQSIHHFRASADTVQATAESAQRVVSQFELIASDANVEGVNLMLTDLQAAAHNARTLSAELQETRGELNQTLQTLNLALDENRGDVRAVLADLRKTMAVVSQHVDGMTYQLDSASRNLNDFTRQIRRNPAVLVHGDNPVSK